jgi:hypothetical protein
MLAIGKSGADLLQGGSTPTTDNHGFIVHYLQTRLLIFCEDIRAYRTVLRFGKNTTQVLGGGQIACNQASLTTGETREAGRSVATS